MKTRLLHELVGLLLFAGIAPLLVVSALLIHVGRQHVEQTVREVHQLEANATAASVDRFMRNAEEKLSTDLEGSVETMSDAEVHATLVWMISRSDNVLLFRILRVHDNRGAPVGDAVYLPPESIPEEHQKAWLVRPEDVAEFDRHAPLAEALKSGQTRISDVYFNPQRREALVAMAVPLKDHLKQVTAVVTGEVSLRDVQRSIADVVIGSVGRAYLVDAQGTVIAHPKFDLVAQHASFRDLGVVSEALANGRAGTASYTGPAGERLLGAHAPVFWGGWQLVVEQPQSDAFKPVSAMRTRAGYILLVALLASVVLAWLWVRSLTSPLRTVMDGMRRIVDGAFDQRLDVPVRNEIGELAAAFNQMGRMLGKYKTEVEAYNRELQARVDAKSRQLESAQDHLIRSAKLSAVGQLGAGVAHELNNPLAGVVGQAALLRRRLRKCDGLMAEERERLEGYVDHIERESSRCREIIHGLLAFSQASSAGADMVELNASLGRLLALVSSNLRASGVIVREDLDPAVGALRINEQQVQQVVMQLLSNAQQAMPSGGTITVRTRALGESVSLEVEDEGRGIPAEHLDRIFDPFFTTKDVWQSPGLGLSVVHSLVELHGGRVEVKSEVGRGTVFTVFLPRDNRTSSSGAFRGAEPGAHRRQRAAAAAR